MRGFTCLICAVLAIPLSGCIASTAADLVTTPVRVAGKAVDLATTSQSESDEKRGRELRKREERLRKLERRYKQLRDDCTDGDSSACSESRVVYAEMQQLSRTIPAPPDETR